MSRGTYRTYFSMQFYIDRTTLETVQFYHKHAPFSRVKPKVIKIFY